MAKKKTVEHIFPELAKVKDGDREYTIHQLTNKGVMVLLRMLGRMGAVLDWKEIYESIGRDDESTNVLLITKVVSAIPIVEQQVYDLLALLLKIEAQEAEELRPETTLSVLEAFFKQEDIEGLMRRFFALIGSLQAKEIVGESS